MTKSATRQAREVVKTVWNPISWNQSQSVAKLASHGRTISAAKKTPRTVRITLRAPGGMGGSEAGAGRSKGCVMPDNLPLRGAVTTSGDADLRLRAEDFAASGLTAINDCGLSEDRGEKRSAVFPLFLSPHSLANPRWLLVLRPQFLSPQSAHTEFLLLGGDQDNAVGSFGSKSLEGRAALDDFH